MNDQVHIIGKQVIKLEVDDRHKLDHIVETVLEDVSLSINKSVIEFFDQFDPYNINIKINELVLDLGVVPEHELGESFQRSLFEKLYKNLKEQIQGEEVAGIHERKSNKSIIQIWNFFLKKGYFPWWSAIQTADELEQKIISDIQSSDVEISVLAKSIKESLDSFLRFHYQFSPFFVSRFLDDVPTHDRTLKRFMKEIKQFSAEEKFQNDFSSETFTRSLAKLQFAILSSTDIKSVFGKEPKLWETFFFQVLDGNTESGFRKWLAKELTILESIEQASSQLSLFFEKIQIRKDVNHRSFEHPDKQKKSRINLKNVHSTEGLMSGNPNKFKPDIERKDDTTDKSNGSDVYGSNSVNMKMDEDSGLEDFSKLNPDVGEEIFITNAGIIILHPYLTQLFNLLGLLKDEVFIDENSTGIAIHLLGYMATGQTQLSEEQLMMSKILCGANSDIPIERRLILTIDQRTEAEKMLQAVISHWKALGNTSINGLRDSFLNRKGKLTFAEGQWQLRVEQKSIDILVSKIPWGISPIKLPWMDTILFVTWP